MKHQNAEPPKFADRFLGWFCKGDLLEEILGDLYEYYDEIADQPKWKRTLIYWFHVLNFLRPFAFKNLEGTYHLNYYGMFKNYFKTSFRSLIKNPLTSFINIVGLSVAIGVCLVVYAFMQMAYGIDEFHENKNEVYVATYFVDKDGTVEQYGRTPTPLGKMLREDFAHIKKVCRVDDRSVVIKYGNRVFHERIRYTDPEFLEMLTFPMKWGVGSSLQDPNSIILSEETSIKYFGNESPIGQVVLVKFNDEKSKTFTVSGVAQAFPIGRTIDFNFLINFENFQVSEPSYDLNNWSGLVAATMIQVEKESDLTAVQVGMEKYRDLHNATQSEWHNEGFAFEKLAGLHIRSKDIRDDISFDAFYEGRVVLPFIAIFMLILACFNYINMAIVSAAKRLKEIGLRKVIGASRGLVAIQFLIENIFVTFFALILGLLLAMAIFLPWFIQLAGLEMYLNLTDQNLWAFMVFVVVVTGLASGIYPAIYISRFDVIRIFKGSVQFGKKNPLTKIFLGAQLILACLGITGAVMFTQNSAYQGSRNWGYNQHEALYVEVPDQSSFEQLHAVMGRNADVESISASKHHLGRSIGSTIIHMPDRQYEVQQLLVDANYFTTMELNLLQGRDFKEHYESDKQSVIINEEFVKKMELATPLGTSFKMDSVRYEIVGVVKNFHSKNFYYELVPTFFKVAETSDYRYLSMRVRSGAEQSAYEALQEEWVNVLPETPFQGGYQEDVWSVFRAELTVMQKFMRAVAYIAVLLAGLGLYGLVTLNVSGRRKEFSIRKVLGAEMPNIARSIIKQYALLSVTALTLGAPISYVLIQANLDMMFPHPMPQSYSGVLLAVMILISVMAAVIFTQIRKVSTSNPVEGLKVE